MDMFEHISISFNKCSIKVLKYMYILSTKFNGYTNFQTKRILMH